MVACGYGDKWFKPLVRSSSCLQLADRIAEERILVRHPVRSYCQCDTRCISEWTFAAPLNPSSSDIESYVLDEYHILAGFSVTGTRIKPASLKFPHRMNANTSPRPPETEDARMRQKLFAQRSLGLRPPRFTLLTSMLTIRYARISASPNYPTLDESCPCPFRHQTETDCNLK